MNSFFTNPKSNDELVRLKGKDLKEFLANIGKHYILYRSSLGLPNSITFGIEIEYESASQNITDRFVEKNLSSWNSKSDGSLENGGEVTSPIMRDELRYWRELKKMCSHLKKRNVDTIHNAGGHIHIGVNVLSEDIGAWKTFFKVYTAYEHIIFRFLYGDKISARQTVAEYAKPVAGVLYEGLEQINKINSVKLLDRVIDSYNSANGRYVALNLSNVDIMEQDKYKDTIEFRNPNATTNEVIIQNNINMLTKLLLSAKQHVIDEDFLDYKLKDEPNSRIIGYPNITDALEFADMIFDNNLDKVNFIIQYCKFLQDTYKYFGAIKAQNFTRGRKI